MYVLSGKMPSLKWCSGVTLAQSPWACSMERTKLLGHTAEAVTATPHIVGYTLSLTTNDE